MLGSVVHAVADPILDRQKLKVLQPVLERDRSLRTEKEWKEEISMRLNEDEYVNTARILEALRYLIRYVQPISHIHCVYIRTWKPYGKESRDMAHEIVHLWMMCGDTVLEHHLTTFAFLKINTRLEYVAQYHAEWLYERFHRTIVLAMWPDLPPAFEFAALVKYFVLWSVGESTCICSLIYDI